MKRRSSVLNRAIDGARAYGPNLVRSLVQNPIVACLLLCSGFATWWGMNGFLLGLKGIALKDIEDTTGSISLFGTTVPPTYLIGAAVVVLTLLMWEALKECLRPRRWVTLLVAVPLYLFLFVWSVGFAYGFWWSLIAGRADTEVNIQVAMSGLRIQADAIAGDLKGGVRVPVQDVADESIRLAKDEEEDGTTCGIPSKPGPGKLYGRRYALCDSIVTINDRVQRLWIDVVAAELLVLEQAVNVVTSSDDAPLDFLRSQTSQDDRSPPKRYCPDSPHDPQRSGNDPNTRQFSQQNSSQQDQSAINSADARSAGGASGENTFLGLVDRKARFEFVRRELTRVAEGINNRNRTKGEEFGEELLEWSKKLSIEAGEPGFYCHDPYLSDKLETAAQKVSAERVELKVPQLSFGEGPEGVSVAILRLWGLAGSLFSQITALPFGQKESANPTHIDNLGESDSGRGIVALIAAVGIDFGIFALAVFKRADLRRPVTPNSGGIEWIDARALPLGQRRRALQDIILDALAEFSDGELKLLRASLGHYRGQHFFILPNIKIDSAEEGIRATAMNHLAGALLEIGGLKPLLNPSEAILSLSQAQLRHVGWSEAAAGEPEILEIEKRGEFGVFLMEFNSIVQKQGRESGSARNLKVPATDGRVEGADDFGGKNGESNVDGDGHDPEETSTAGPVSGLPDSSTRRNFFDIFNQVTPPPHTEMKDNHESADDPFGNEEPLDQSNMISAFIELLNKLEAGVHACTNESEIENLENLINTYAKKLDQLGIERFGRDDVKFDPNSHNAIDAQPSSRLSGTILRVVRSGYRGPDRIIQYPDVIVSSGEAAASDTPSDNGEVD